MNERATQNATIEKIENGWKLGIQKGDSLHYRDAQLDDYFGLSRHKFPHHSLTLRHGSVQALSLRARASSISIPGTWGFGLWNDPFGMSLGFGGNPFRLPALPNAVWFFSASKENYLSFRSPSTTPSKTDGSAHIVPTVFREGGAAQGFLAQSFRSPKFHPRLIPAGLALPFSRKVARNLLSKVIGEDSSALSVNVTQWHGYRFEWSQKRVLFYVDDVQVFESPVSPNPPLGLIIWIDNQYAAFTPEGKIGFGVLENPEPAWIEITDLSLS